MRPLDQFEEMLKQSGLPHSKWDEPKYGDGLRDGKILNEPVVGFTIEGGYSGFYTNIVFVAADGRLFHIAAYE